MSKFLKSHKGKIMNGSRPVSLRGVNVGGWLMMEAYILYAPNYPEQYLKKNIKEKLGVSALEDFEKSFRASFITEKDFKQIADFGFNCVRVPFNHKLIEPKPYEYDLKGVKYLDDVIRWAKKYDLWVILDLHGAPGCQNHDWHSDSYGQAELWTEKENQNRVYALWEFLADRYKDETAVAGYDLLNEAVLDNNELLNHFYKQTIKAIRKSDKNHILFIEGNRWAQDLNCLDVFDDDNQVLSIHYYLPIEFTFNFVPHMHYPLKERGFSWNKQSTKKFLEQYQKVSKERQVPVYVGEFGVNARLGLFGEDRWVKDTVSCFEDFGFHWTYWTYKAVKNGINPDGIYSYCDNPKWVNRLGPLTGWDTYPQHWGQHKNEMVKSWGTDQFILNKEILKALKR